MIAHSSNDYMREYMKSYWRNNPKKYEEHKERVRLNKNPSRKDYNRRYMYLLKLDIIYHYSSGEMCCACCPEKEIDFLSIDHANNDGAQQRKNFELASGSSFFLWLRRNNYPKNLGLRVLCYNCNMGRRINEGNCPHKLR